MVDKIYIGCTQSRREFQVLWTHRELKREMQMKSALKWLGVGAEQDILGVVF